MLALGTRRLSNFELSILSAGPVAAVVTLGHTATDGVGRSLLHPFAQHRTSSSNLHQPRRVAGGQRQGGLLFLFPRCSQPISLFACPNAPGPPSPPSPQLEGQSESSTRALGPPACLHLAHVALLEPRPTPLRDPRGSAPLSPPPQGPSTEPSPHPSNSAQSWASSSTPAALHWMDPGAFPNARRMPLPLIFPQRAEASPSYPTQLLSLIFLPELLSRSPFSENHITAHHRRLHCVAGHRSPPKLDSSGGVGSVRRRSPHSRIQQRDTLPNPPVMIS